MNNTFLKERAARDIDTRVERLLKDLGNPEPPLRLELVSELLNLDRAYYSSSDGGVLQETVHRLKIAGKQVMRRPGILLDVVKKLDLKALWIPDRKRILIDSDLPSLKHRWAESHEIGHSIIPWHESVMHGDHRRTLHYECHAEIEHEANYAAGRMLFLQDAFTERLRSQSPTIDLIKQLAREFGNSITSTLYRAVESSNEMLFGLVSQHPNTVNDSKPAPFRYYVRSQQFTHKFGDVTGLDIFSKLGTFCTGKRGPIGSSEVLFKDTNGQEHLFFVDVFFNSYDTLTLGAYRRACTTSISIPA